MSKTIISENETEFQVIIRVIKEIRANSKRPDNQATVDQINKTMEHNNKIIRSVLGDDYMTLGLPG